MEILIVPRLESHQDLSQSTDMTSGVALSGEAFGFWPKTDFNDVSTCTEPIFKKVFN